MIHIYKGTEFIANFSGNINDLWPFLIAAEMQYYDTENFYKGALYTLILED